MNLYFPDAFAVSPKKIERYGAFNISLVADLPLFVEPFLIFNSRKPKYRRLHRGIVRYLRFLFRKAQSQHLTQGLLASWYRFPEITENWLGFSEAGNQGRGLGSTFAGALHENLGLLFDGLNRRRITKDVHLETLCLVSDRVGRDNVSDFTTNLIHGCLLEYTSAFATEHIDKSLRRVVSVRKARFNYQTQTWVSARFDLPYHNGQHVLLAPRELLTKDDTWINKTDLFEDFDDLPEAIPNEQLRQQVSNYFRQVLPRPRKRRRIKKREHDAAVLATIKQFPELIDYYIRNKEDRGGEAKKLAGIKIGHSDQLYVRQVQQLRTVLQDSTDFYKTGAGSYEAARQRALFLKDAIENKGCHKIFYVNGQPIERELDLQILYRLTWYGTSYDVSREVNDGRGPADYKISKGARDKSLVEMKLASNSSLERNLKNQTIVYQKASDATKSVTIIICWSANDQRNVQRILKTLRREGDASIVVIDARLDGKPSGSKA